MPFGRWLRWLRPLHRWLPWPRLNMNETRVAGVGCPRFRVDSCCWCGLTGIPCFVVPLKHGIMLERDSCCWCGLTGIPCFVVPLKHCIMLERDSCCWCGLSGIPRGNPYICYDYNDYICYDRGKARDVDNGDRGRRYGPCPCLMMI